MNHEIVCILNGVLDWDQESYDVIVGDLSCFPPNEGASYMTQR